MINNGNARFFYFLRDTIFQIKNTRFWNYVTWNFLWDWSRYGEEWTKLKEWKKSLAEEIIYPNITKKSYVLEIGPGGGRWTEFLLQKSKKITLVDISPKCIKICKRRFSHRNNIDYFVNDGIDLNFIPDKAIDFVWSFDVFVHIDPEDIARYLMQFYRVLKKGGKCIIHHANIHKRNKRGWRSDMNDELFTKMLLEKGFTLIRQFDSWGNGKYNVKYDDFTHDTLSYFKK